MVRAKVKYKVKQHNGTITTHKEENVEAETYDKFLDSIEKEMKEISEKLGRKVRIETSDFERNSIGIKSKDFKAKEAIQYIRETKKEKLKNFLSDDEGRTTILDAYKNKFK